MNRLKLRRGDGPPAGLTDGLRAVKGDSKMEHEDYLAKFLNCMCEVENEIAELYFEPEVERSAHGPHVSWTARFMFGPVIFIRLGSCPVWEHMELTAFDDDDNHREIYNAGGADVSACFKAVADYINGVYRLVFF